MASRSTEAVASVRDAGRLAALKAYRIVDTAPDDRFDALTALAAKVLDMPVVLVSLVEADRQWFKSRHGFDGEETPIEQAICVHVLQVGVPVVIPDTHADPRTAANAICHGHVGARFYAGAPMIDPDGHIIGTVCALDFVPREFPDEKLEMLVAFAGQAMELIRLHGLLAEKELARQETDHRIKNSLSALMATLRMQRRGLAADDTAAQDVLRATEARIGTLAALHEALCYTETGMGIECADFLRKAVAAASIGAPEGVRVGIRVAPRLLDSQVAASLGTVVNEFVQNSIKHAFPDGREGRIDIEGIVVNDGRYRITLSDDGIGLPNTLVKRGLGLKIIESTASQFKDFTAGTGPTGQGCQLTFLL